ncbi:hypothetical protein [Streptomyces sp. NPDC052494]|uniref:hypothetical protein n=1 Tax=Streptomyces sp. NPDC052494 TaxID=3365692 RepID=UPI0037D8A652
MTQKPYEVGEHVQGMTYVPPERVGREHPREFVGVIVQVGSGWAGVDAAKSYVWCREQNGKEVQALTKEIERVENSVQVEGVK